MNQQTIKVAGVVLLIASAPLIAFLGLWEDRPNTVYPDKLAAGLPTVCAGITKHVTDLPIVVGDYWPDLKCEEIETLVVAKTQTKLASCIKRPVSQETFDALTSMAHNVGVGGVCASRALRLINQGKTKEGCKAISRGPNGAPVWSYTIDAKGNQRFIQGLFNRRLAESGLCMKGLA
jgi:GH24 family phage-related lysozyme (muramidase)